MSYFDFVVSDQYRIFLAILKRFQFVNFLSLRVNYSFLAKKKVVCAILYCPCLEAVFLCP